jgi:HK97 family phage prohead protease
MTTMRLALLLAVALVRDVAALVRRRRPAAVRFDSGPALTLATQAGVVFTVDTTSRTISGLILPWDTEARSGGRTWSFPQGSVRYGADPSRVKLWVQHDPNRAVGFATALEHRDSPVPGLYGTYKVARGAAGDEALAMAEDRVWDGFSVGIAEGGTYDERDGVTYAVDAPLMETSLTPAPAFDDARVHDVAATAARTPGRNNMKCNSCGVEHAAGVTACDPAAVAAFTAANPPATPAGTVAEGASFTIDDLVERFATAMSNTAAPPVVSATAGLEVDEALPYRFDGVEGAHEFSGDLIAFGRDRDGDAGERLMRFMAEAFRPGPRSPKFDVTSTDGTAALNPTRSRPDLYVDQREFRTPVYDALYSGALTDNTPFLVPKFVSDTTLVADHVEGVEPTNGDMQVTSQTVTPSPVSGKVPISREVWDQGGNPQVSGLLWGRMRYEFYRNLESAAAAVLTANAGSITDIPITTGAVDAALVNNLEAALADLQFQAGADTIDTAMTHVDLYKRLAAAVDTTGRKLIPLYGVTNGNGQARPRFASLDVAGYEFAPAWSLGATTGGASAANSWLFDRQAVHLWNSEPKRLDFEYRVAFVDVALWGYKAAAVTDVSGVRQITYDMT